MTVVDIRNMVTDSSVELLEINTDFIYYAEEKLEEGHNSLFLLEYNIKEKKERVLSHYFITNPVYVPHYFTFENDILAVLEDGGSTIWVLRVSKDTGEEKNFEQVHLIGDFSGCVAVSEKDLLIFTKENQKHMELFKEYHRITGLEQILYLYDLKEKKYRYLRDDRINKLTAENIFPYKVYGETTLIFLAPHGDVQEKEEHYENRHWVGDKIRDNIWSCSLNDFLQAVYEERSRVPLKTIFSIGTKGMVRYAGMDDYNLYFLARYFPTNDQRICAASKATLRRDVVADLNSASCEPNSEMFFLMDTAAAKAYCFTKQEDTVTLKGILNSKANITYDARLGEFISCVNDRFLVMRTITQDDTETFVMYHIYDSKEEKSQSYECQCAVKDEIIVLY